MPEQAGDGRPNLVLKWCRREVRNNVILLQVTCYEFNDDSIFNSIPYFASVASIYATDGTSNRFYPD